MGKRENVLLLVRSTDKIRKKIEFPVIVQPKLNGVRALIYRKYMESDTLFKNDEYEIYIESSEGNRYILPHLNNDLEEIFNISPNIILDGELYIHGESLNRIIARIPKTNSNGVVSKPSISSDDIEFHIFDIKNEMKQRDRLYNILHGLKVTLEIDEITLSHIKFVDTTLCGDLSTLENKLNDAIDLGYEGIVYRFPMAYYLGGKKRVKLAGKWKKAFDTECEVLDVISEGYKDSVYVIKFLLKNDINDETFLCNVGDSDGNAGYWTNFMKERTYQNRQLIRGKLSTIKYYERSGIKKVPFHANLITIRDYE